MAEQEPPYSQKIYGIMKQLYGDKFTHTPESFEQKLNSDTAYVNKVYGIMREAYGNQFTHTPQSFADKLKKKGVTTQGSGQPVQQPGKPSAPSFGQKVVNEALTQEVQVPLKGQQKAPVQKKPYQDIYYKPEELPSETVQATTRAYSRTIPDIEQETKNVETQINRGEIPAPPKNPVLKEIWDQNDIDQRVNEKRKELGIKKTVEEERQEVGRKMPYMDLMIDYEDEIDDYIAYGGNGALGLSDEDLEIASGSVFDYKKIQEEGGLAAVLEKKGLSSEKQSIVFDNVMKDYWAYMSKKYPDGYALNFDKYQKLKSKKYLTDNDEQFLSNLESRAFGLYNARIAKQMIGLKTQLDDDSKVLNGINLKKYTEEVGKINNDIEVLNKKYQAREIADQDYQSALRNYQERFKKLEIETGVNDAAREKLARLQETQKALGKQALALNATGQTISNQMKSYPGIMQEYEEQEQNQKLRDEFWSSNPNMLASGAMAGYEAAKGFSDSVAKMFISSAAGIWKAGMQAGPLFFATDKDEYDMTDIGFDAIMNAQTNMISRDYIKENDSTIATIANLAGSGLGSATAFILGGEAALAVKAPTWLGVFLPAYLSQEADIYNELINTGKYNAAEASVVSNALAIPTAAVEIIVPEVPAAKGFGTTLTQSIIKGEAIGQAFKSSVKSYTTQMLKEGGEEGLAMVVDYLARNTVNAIGQQKYLEDKFNTKEFQDAVLGGMIVGGVMNKFRKFDKKKSPTSESAEYEIVKRGDDIIKAHTGNETLPTVKAELKKPMETLSGLEAHPNWGNLDENKKAHVFSITRDIEELESSKIQDPIIKAQIQKLKSEREEILALGTNGVDAKAVGTSTAPQRVMIGGGPTAEQGRELDVLNQKKAEFSTPRVAKLIAEEKISRDQAEAMVGQEWLNTPEGKRREELMAQTQGEQAYFYINEEGDYEIQYNNGRSVIIPKGEGAAEKIRSMGIKTDEGEVSGVVKENQNTLITPTLEKGATVDYNGKNATVNGFKEKDGKVVYVNITTEDGRNLQIREGQVGPGQELLNNLNKLGYDQENQVRVSSEVGVGQEPVTTQPIEGAGTETTEAGGVLQTQEEVTPTTEAAPEVGQKPGTAQKVIGLDYKDGQEGQYSDDNVYGDIRIVGEDVEILDWNSKYTGRGNTEKSLQKLKQNYGGEIRAVDAGYKGEESYSYWQRMLDKGLIDGFYDDNGVLHTEKTVTSTKAAPEVKAEEKTTAPVTEETKPTKPTRKERLAGLFKGEEKPTEEPVEKAAKAPAKPFSGIKNLFKKGFGGKRVSEREAMSLTKELNTLIDRAEKENGVQRDSLNHATWKTNDGYTITEFFENKRGGTRITTPEGEEINIYDNKYKSETGKEISYFPGAGKPAVTETDIEASEVEKTAQALKSFDKIIKGNKTAGTAVYHKAVDLINKKKTHKFTGKGWDDVAEAYHKALKNGSNPELVDLIDSVLKTAPETKPTRSEKIATLFGEKEVSQTEKPKTPKATSKIPDKKGIPSKFTKDNINELVGATVVVVPTDGPMKVLEVRGPFDPYEGYATFNTKKGLTEEYVLIGEDDRSTSIFINDKGQLESSIEESVFTSDPNAKFILKEATEETPLSITEFKKGDIVKYVKDGQQYEVLSVDPKALSSIKNIQTGEVIKVAYPADFLPSSREEVVTEKAEATPAETVVETPAEETPVSENEAVNQLITKKSRYNKIPKTKKPLAGKLLNEIKTEAERLGFTVVNVNNSRISIVNKKDGKVVARRDVDRKFNKAENDKLKEAKSMAGDFTFGLRGVILLYFIRGGKINTGSSELGEGTKELQSAKNRGIVSDTGPAADKIVERLPELGAVIYDEQEAIGQIQDVVASYENVDQMEEDLIEMLDKFNNDMDEAAKYEYESQMRAAIRNNELVGLDEDELVEYYESLSEDEKLKTIEDYEKFYQEIESEQSEQGGQGRPGTNLSAKQEKATRVSEAVPAPRKVGAVEASENNNQKAGVESALAGVGLNEKSLEEWKNANRKISKKGRIEELTQAVRNLMSGKIQFKEYYKEAKRLMPSRLMDKVPALTSFKEIVGSIDRNKLDIGIINLNKFIKKGTRVGLRIDIPSFNNFGNHVVTIHDPKGSRPVIGYGSTGSIQNVTFKTSVVTASKIGAGEFKAPFAMANGEWLDESAESIQARAEEALSSPEWIQVGMNPTRSSFFFDKADGNPVVAADEVLQVGNLVLAKNARKIDLNTEEGMAEFKNMFSARTAQGVTYQFREARRNRLAKMFETTDGKIAVEKVAKFLREANIDVEILDSKSFKEKSQQKNFEADSDGVFLVDNNTGKIYLNSESIKSAEGKVIAFHEGIHPVVNIIRNTNPKLYQAIVSGLNAEASKNKQIAEIAAAAAESQYNQSQGPSAVEDETVVETMSQIAAGNINIDTFKPTLREKLIEFMNKIAKILGFGQIKVNSPRMEVKRLADQLSKALNEGGKLSDIVGKKGVSKFQYAKGGQPSTIKRTSAELRQLMEDSMDSVDELIANGVDAQTAVDDNISSQDWYGELTPKQKEQFDEIVQDEFGVTPKAQPKQEAPKAATKTMASIEETAKALEGVDLESLFEKTKSTKYFRGQPVEELPKKDIFISPNEIVGKMYTKGTGVLKKLSLKTSNLFDIDTIVTNDFNDKLINAWRKSSRDKTLVIPKDVLNGNYVGSTYSQSLKENEQFRRALEGRRYDGLLNNFTRLKLPSQRQEVIVFDQSNVSEINADLISELYHKAKEDGSNPELVRAVEDLIGKPEIKTAKTTKTEVGENIKNIVDNYYKLREGSKDEKRAAKAAINEILDADPKLKYIYNNISNINKELQAAGLITDKTDGCP